MITKEKIEKARKALSNFCKDKYTMSIPPQKTDDDMVIHEFINSAEKILETVSEGFEDFYYENFKDCSTNKVLEYLKPLDLETWQAAKLSSAKEIEELKEKLVKCNNNRIIMQGSYDETLKERNSLLISSRDTSEDDEYDDYP